MAMGSEGSITALSCRSLSKSRLTRRGLILVSSRGFISDGAATSRFTN